MASASATSTSTATEDRGSRGGLAHAATQWNTPFEALIGPSSHAQQSHVAPSTASPQTPPTSNRPHPSSSRSRQQSIAPSAADQHPRVNLDPTTASGSTRKDLLREAFFPDWKDDASKGDLDHPDEMQKRDPLGTQIWKLYSKTKTQLPNQERMENLTWRMMAMNLKKRKEREQALYVVRRKRFHFGAASDDVLWLTDHGRLSRQATSAPSGISRLRSSQDEINNAQDDPMNIDDYIFPGSTASPAGASPSPPLETTPAPSAAMASAIPIKTKKGVPEPSHPEFPPSAPPQDRSRSNEFGYVQRRVRKTSIDETRVRERYVQYQRSNWLTHPDVA